MEDTSINTEDGLVKNNEVMADEKVRTIFPTVGTPTGATRFRKAAISVLSKVVESKNEEEDITEDEDKIISSANHGGPLSRSISAPEGLPLPPKRRSLPLSRITQEREPTGGQQKSRRLTLPTLSETIPTERKQASKAKRKKSTVRTPSLASIVGLVTFRKLYMAKLKRDEEKSRRMSVTESERSDPEPTPPPPIIRQKRIQTPFLPSIPRFAATLSSEAQFATLKGYEDMVLDRLENTFPSKSDYHWGELRTKTPMVPALDMDEEEDELDKDGQILASAPCNLNSTSDLNSSGQRRPRKVYKTNPPRKHKKQLRITYRLEYAMDMLDTISEELGEVSISPRRKQMKRNVDPVESCEDWIYGWKQEFVYTR